MWNSPLRNTSPPCSNIIHLKQIKRILQTFTNFFNLGPLRSRQFASFCQTHYKLRVQAYWSLKTFSRQLFCKKLHFRCLTHSASVAP